MSDNSFKNTKQLLATYGLSAKKKFGQNFLTDQNVLNKIVELAKVDSSKHVVEIGPGLGALTQVLINTVGEVTAYEIDSDMVSVLNDRFKDCDNLTVVQDDILKTDLNFSNPITIVANLPYYITTPILFKLLESNTRIERIVIMVQKEVGDRLTAREATKDYNALSVIVQYLAETRYGFTVSRESFIPKPNVESAVIELEMRNTPPVHVESEKDFFEYVKACFKQRRKTLINNLSLSFGTKEDILAILVDLDINPKVRAEALTLLQFSEIYNEIKKKTSGN